MERSSGMRTSGFPREFACSLPNPPRFAGEGNVFLALFCCAGDGIAVDIGRAAVLLGNFLSQ